MSELEGQMALFNLDGCEADVQAEFADESHCQTCDPGEPCPHCPVCNTEDD